MTLNTSLHAEHQLDQLAGQFAHWRQTRTQVAYPALADNSRGPLASRPRGLSPLVVRSRIGFSASHGLSLPACRHTDPALLDNPLPAPSATALKVAATVGPGSTIPLSGSTHDPSDLPPSPGYTAATPSPNHNHWWVQVAGVAGAGWRGARQSCDRRGTAPTDPARLLHPDTGY